MDLNSGPPATGKGEIWENMRLGREKAGEFASKVWVLVLWPESRVRYAEICGLWNAQ